jgi:hypothetical protein
MALSEIFMYVLSSKISLKIGSIIFLELKDHTAFFVLDIMWIIIFMIIYT